MLESAHALIRKIGIVAFFLICDPGAWVWVLRLRILYRKFLYGIQDVEKFVRLRN